MFSKLLIKQSYSFEFYGVPIELAYNTLIFKTTTTEPGFNVVAFRKNAEIDAEVQIVEPANRSKVVATITVENSPGRTFGGYDYYTGLRLSEAYAAAGKYLGKFIKNNSNSILQ